MLIAFAVVAAPLGAALIVATARGVRFAAFVASGFIVNT